MIDGFPANDLESIGCGKLLDRTGVFAEYLKLNEKSVDDMQERMYSDSVAVLRFSFDWNSM